ncbi:uncharacterized protein HMPREF1541_01268 [Cyphellophora europaea CBS 101466]|uniref:ATPase inhibitor, mitochondrial n=1 Tax=Cyphellophora europaea (strain CBS 101466) TaxID=1220924 RepID=W2SGE8_CYPE1|nr:uncharacterized protein HMPREF1541_01268 [Cyphellophora europaea CBS 101466]ETN47078.1 hypothetical protein HMPREF1541_01268 [Cyphellophora europaea CBS 101466]
MLGSQSSAGDTGSVRPGGEAASDSFQKREQALENMYIHQRELENLKKIQEKLARHRAHLEELDMHVGEMVEAKTEAVEKGK